MQFKIKKEIIQPALEKCAFISSAKTTHQILKNTLLDASETLTLRATNLEEGYEKTIFEVQILEPGKITVDTQKLLDIVKSFPPCELIFRESGNQIKIFSEEKGIKAVFNLNFLPADDFPELPETKLHTNGLTIDSNVLKSAIQKTIFAVSNESARFFLNGICFDFSDKGNFAVSTDGRRLAKYQFNIQTEKTFRQTLPDRFLNSLIKSLNNQNIEIIIENKIAYFVIDATERFISNVLDGNFPDWTKVIDIEFSNCVIFNKAEMVAKIDRVAKMTDNKINRVTCQINKDKIILKANNEIGEAFEECNVETNGDFPEIELGINYIFFLEAIKAVDENKIKLSFIDETRQINIAGETNNCYNSIIMPMKI